MEYSSTQEVVVVVEEEGGEEEGEGGEEEEAVCTPAYLLLPLPSQIITRESMLATALIGEGFKVGDAIACCHEAAGQYPDGTYETPFSAFIDRILSIYSTTLYPGEFIRAGNYMAVEACEDMLGHYSVGELKCSAVGIAAVVAYCGDNEGWEKFLIDLRDIADLTQLSVMNLLLINGQTVTTNDVDALRQLRLHFQSNDAIDRLLYLCGFLVV